MSHSNTYRRGEVWSKKRNNDHLNIFQQSSSSMRIKPQILSLRRRPSLTVNGMVLVGGDANTVFNNSPIEFIASNNIPESITLLLERPEFWSGIIMLSIIFLLWLWETLIENLKELSPKYIHQVIDATLAEMGGIGFIGLFISTILHNPIFHLSTTLNDLSEEYLGNEEILFESFEFLHQTIFQAAVAFFIATGITILLIVNTLEQMTKFSGRCVIEVNKKYTDDNQNSLYKINSRLVDVIGTTTLPSSSSTSTSRIGELVEYDDNSNYSVTMNDEEARIWMEGTATGTIERSWIKELTKTKAQRGAEVLLLRECLVRDLQLPLSFEINQYLTTILATDELDIVSIAPTTWLPLIPAIACFNAIDIKHDVVNSGATNAIASSGYFIGTTSILGLSIVITSFILTWGLSNYWKMAQIKSMLIPQLVEDDTTWRDDDRIRILSPAAKNDNIRKQFQSTTWWMNPIESLFRIPSTNPIEEMFGTAGGAGPRLYGTSIKLQSWSLFGHLVVVTSQIIPRDISAWILINQGGGAVDTMIGIPELVVPEIIFHSFLAILVILQLVVLNPISFFNYSLIRCVNDMIDPKRRDKILQLCSNDNNVNEEEE